MSEQAERQEVVKSFKGFDRDMVCRPDGGERVQYEVGQSYSLDGDIEVCRRGFHACEGPLDVLAYYPAGSSRFAVVEQSGRISRENRGSKIASSRIKVIAELSLSDLIEATVEYRQAKAEGAETGNSTADQGVALATSARGAASSPGYQGAAMASGHSGKVMGAEGNALFLVERDYEYNIVAVWAGIAGHDGIKPRTWYTLRDGEPVEV